MMGMQEVIAKIAKGPKASKDLTWDEAKRAIHALIEGDGTPAQAGAFLIAMRFKMESVTELAAFTAATRSYVAPLPISQELGVVDLPSYAGKQDTFHALAGAAIVAAAAGAAILMHGYDGVPGRPGNAGLLKALGIPTDLESKAVAALVSKQGFAYLDIALYHPPLYRFLEMRQELGVRNVFHPIARLLNPARAASQVIGLTHPPHFEKTAEAVRMLGMPRALVIRGVEGDPAFVDPVLQLVGGIRPVNLAVSPDDLKNGGRIEAHAGVITVDIGSDWFRRLRLWFRRGSGINTHWFRTIGSRDVTDLRFGKLYLADLEIADLVEAANRLELFSKGSLVA